MAEIPKKVVAMAEIPPQKKMATMAEIHKKGGHHHQPFESRLGPCPGKFRKSVLLKEHVHLTVLTEDTASSFTSCAFPSCSNRIDHQEDSFTT